MCEQTCISKRQVCRLLNQSRSTQNYRKEAASNHGKSRESMRSILLENFRYGYRRLHRQLLQEGFAVNHKLMYRLYRQMDWPEATQGSPLQERSTLPAGGFTRLWATALPRFMPNKTDRGISILYNSSGTNSGGRSYKNDTLEIPHIS